VSGHYSSSLRSYKLYSISNNLSSKSREGVGKPKGYSDASIRYVMNKEMQSGLPYTIQHHQHHNRDSEGDKLRGSLIDDDRSSDIAVRRKPYIVMGKSMILLMMMIMI